MTDRDWFAAFALAGMLADENVTSIPAAVKTALDAADQMMEARKARPEQEQEP